MKPTDVKRFRIVEIKGPIDRGYVKQFHDYILTIELERGSRSESAQMKIAVRFSDLTFSRLAKGDPSNPKYSKEAHTRVASFAIRALKQAFAATSPDFGEVFSPTHEEADELVNLDLSSIDIVGWHDVPRVLKRTNRVFISCGQQTEEEIELGKDVVQSVNDTEGLAAYFAEDQSSLNGVTSDIFRAIYTASAFIAIMHRRDQIAKAVWRGSVWVEQEISIAAFLAQALGHQLPSRVYIQEGIKREGVRGYIILNPVPFNTSAEVLQDLHEWLPSLADLSLPLEEP